ncbi:MAG: DUF389 domain-containing protein [Campylobacterota bacterium]|nr:DUF389 domain-containing protein [Campylobacterota bacterium]
MQYYSKALFVHDDEAVKWIDDIKNNTLNCKVHACHLEDFLDNPLEFLNQGEHLIIAAKTNLIEMCLHVAIKYDFSLGFLPYPYQKSLIHHYGLSTNLQSNLEIALHVSENRVDLIECGDKLMQFNATFGDIPLISSLSESHTVLSYLDNLRRGIKQFFKIMMEETTVTTANEKKIKTAVSGIAIVQSSRKNFFSKLSGITNSVRDSQVKMILVSPFSVIAYLRFLFSILSFSKKSHLLSSSIGLVKSKSIAIDAGRSKRLHIDNSFYVYLPVTCKLVDRAVRVSAPEIFWEGNPLSEQSKESIKIDNLPDEKESVKYRNKHIPFFSYASEEHFRDLFSTLRDDANMSTIYIVLMLLSTLLATIGLFANSIAVVIGAMLLAPLMAPIVSFAMGLLRADSYLLQASLIKISWGILLALGASALVTVILPEMQLTSEMKARINPTVLDLGVAIISGIAAAYSKSFKEIIQSLAGVAIAVALVPPLSTAGIGLGQGDMLVFIQAFLLFFTNLIGISLAATLTFLVLGYSSVVKSKKSLIAIVIVMVFITYPLYDSFSKIIEKEQISKATSYERFFINGKYIIVNKARLRYREGKDILDIGLKVREGLNRHDLYQLKRKIEKNYKRELRINASVEYML